VLNGYNNSADAQEHWTISDRLSADIGARFEHVKAVWAGSRGERGFRVGVDRRWREVLGHAGHGDWHVHRHRPGHSVGLALVGGAASEGDGGATSAKIAQVRREEDGAVHDWPLRKPNGAGSRNSFCPRASSKPVHVGVRSSSMIVIERAP
jgi:hypothetical protein